jgi:hypothetical protein
MIIPANRLCHIPPLKFTALSREGFATRKSWFNIGAIAYVCKPPELNKNNLAGEHRG